MKIPLVLPLSPSTAFDCAICREWWREECSDSKCIHVHLYTCIHYMYMQEDMFLMRDEREERKKQAKSNKQTRQSSTAHPRQSLFLLKMSCLRWDMYMYTLYVHVHVYICTRIHCTYIHACTKVHVASVPGPSLHTYFKILR